MEPTASLDQVLRAAFELHRQRRNAEAEALLRPVLDAAPGHEQASDLMMMALYAQGKLEAALATYREAVRLGAYPCDPQYDAIYDAALVATGNSPAPLRRRARFHLLHQLVAGGGEDEACMAECGCFRGMSSYVILGSAQLAEPAYRGGGYHVFDSFQGLSAPTEEDEVPDEHPNAANLRLMCSPGAFSASLAQVRQALAAFPGVEYHAGWVPLTFGGLPERRYRFVHLDLDLYDPTLSALEYFHPRLARGGVIVCDDYGWPGARRAIEEFCQERQTGYTVTDYQQAVIYGRTDGIAGA